MGEAPRPALPEGWTELAHAESSYQSVRVVEDGTSEPALRYLQVNESFDSYQSVWQAAPGLLPTGFYYNDFALPMWWEEAEDGPTSGGATGTCWSWGSEPGTALRVLEGARPPGFELATLGVELDPVVVRAVHPTPGARRRARTRSCSTTWTRASRSTRPSDSSSRSCWTATRTQVEIPAHLCTREFFDEVRERLVIGGWLTANLGGFGFAGPGRRLRRADRRVGLRRRGCCCCASHTPAT